jgi:hypothetical protein
MNIKIDRKIYNTETADLVANTAQGAYGDSTGFAEILYKRGPGDYFLFGHGGADSPYPQPGIFVLTNETARAWLTRIAGEEFANQEFGVAVEVAVAAPKAKAAAKKPAAVKAEEVKAEPVKKAPAKKAAAKKEAPVVQEVVAAKETVKKVAPAEKAPKAVKEPKAAKEPKAPKAPKATK